MTSGKQAILSVGLLVLAASCAGPSPVPGTGEDEGAVVVYRDTWGVPHIYAPNEEAGAWAMGWTQAEDRPDELLRNFMRAIGEIAAVEGPSGLQSDLVAHLWDNYGLCRRRLQELSPRTRSLLVSYVRGVNSYYQSHPDEIPAWWGNRPVDEAMVLAFGRLFLYSWSIDDGFGDLFRSGIEPNFAATQRGSNQWAVAPARAAEGSAILLIDPHLGWEGASRFWEFRIHAGEWAGSGFTLPGFPAIGLGHNQHLAWAMTTGGPDTADIYELRLQAGDPPKYLYDGEWRLLAVRRVEIAVAGAERQSLTLLDSHLGPVVARQGDRAWVHRTAYAESVGALDAWSRLNLGRTYRDAVAAFESLQVFPQNVMVADSEGNIYYQRTGRVPVRPAGYDFSRVVDGTTSATDWQGLHPTRDLVQLLNPPRGYMQNCNVPPDSMLVDSPLQPENYPAYIFSDRSHNAHQLGGWSNPRGSRAVELLEADAAVSAEDALAYAMDLQAFGADRWLALLGRARDRFTGSELPPGLAAAADDLLKWNRWLSPDSTGALKYFRWREQVAAAGLPGEVAYAVTDLMAPLGEAQPLPELSDAHSRLLWNALVSAMHQLHAEEGTFEVAYGDRFRVGRGEQSWPVGGGGGHGTSTLRNVEYSAPLPDGTRRGRAGQTSTQVVVLSKPVRSWTVTPLGQSDRPDSPHFTDQAEQLFSPGKMKPTWWTPEELAGQPKTRTELPFVP